MKKIFNHLKLYKDLIFIFLISVFLSLPYIVDICSGYLNYYKFDLQIFLLWDYASVNHLFPYRDFFYPYGLLNYFKSYNFLYSFVYFLISPTLFSIAYFIFKKVFKDKLMLYFSFFTFYIFVSTVIGFQTFSRYGIFILLSLIITYLFYSRKIISNNVFFCLGIILGMVFALINDLGLYLIIIFIFSYIFIRIIYFMKFYSLSKQYFKIIFKELRYVFLGGLVIISPFFLIIIFSGNLNTYFEYFLDVKDIVLVAETPFFSFINSPANIFTISIIYLAIFYIFLKLFIFKNKVSFSIFFQITLIFDILILEQKSIIRSIDTQITFVSLMILMFLVYDLINLLKTNKLNYRLIYVFFISILIILCGFYVIKKPADFSSVTKSLNLLVANKCFDYNLKYFLLKNPSYTTIVNSLKSRKDFNGNIYSFPSGDSALYILLKQKPPYHNAIFEGSSFSEQGLTIKYIQENKIQFINLNIGKSAIQDGVPDYIRQNRLFKYILNNYYPINLINDHLILKKNNKTDFFKSNILKDAKDYNAYLLNYYIYKIPYSEGLYKYKNLKENGRLLIKTNTIDNVDNFFKKNKINSKDKVIVISSNLNSKSWDLSTLKITTDNGFSTTIIFNTCTKNAKCVINLANIPLFYKNRIITKINKSFKGNIEIFEINNKSNLW